MTEKYYMDTLSFISENEKRHRYERMWQLVRELYVTDTLTRLMMPRGNISEQGMDKLIQYWAERK